MQHVALWRRTENALCSSVPSVCEQAFIPQFFRLPTAGTSAEMAAASGS
jgi:hypothetical protein